MNQEINKHVNESSIINLPKVQEFLNTIPIKISRKKGISDDKPLEKFWYTIDWRKLELWLSRKQHEIFINQNNCRILQEEIINSPYAKLLAIKRVGFANRGKNTAGIDKVKKISRGVAIILAMSLKLDGKAKNIKRVWIPKANSKDKRPLGILTIKDRAKQALLKMALEPQWESRFSPTSFGFRPGRNCIDAIWNIRNVLINGPRYVYDADLEKCFDRISHNYLIEKLGFSENDIITLQVRAWLKAGILDPITKKTEFPTVGTAQGGVISPLLCNIALHGMDEYIINELKKKKFRYEVVRKVKIYTYADDLLIICNNKRILFYIIEAVKNFLIPIGLNVKASKTKLLHTVNRAITHTLNLIERFDEESNSYIFKKDEIYLPIVYGKPYKFPQNNLFNFLGFTFKCFNVGKHKTSKINQFTNSSTKVYVVPSTISIKKHFSVIRSQLRKARTTLEVIRSCSPIITGWLNYFANSDLRTTGGVGKLRTRMNLMLLNWQNRVYRTRKRISKNWKTIKGDKWRLYSIEPVSGKEYILPSHSDKSFNLVKYKSIRLNSSVYDGNISYWSIRLSSVLGLTAFPTFQLSKQKGCCHNCKRKLTVFDDVKVIKNLSKKSKISTFNKVDNTHVVHIKCPT